MEEHFYCRKFFEAYLFAIIVCLLLIFPFIYITILDPGIWWGPLLYLLVISSLFYLLYVRHPNGEIVFDNDKVTFYNCLWSSKTKKKCFKVEIPLNYIVSVEPVFKAGSWSLRIQFGDGHFENVSVKHFNYADIARTLALIQGLDSQEELSMKKKLLRKSRIYVTKVSIIMLILVIGYRVCLALSHGLLF